MKAIKKLSVPDLTRLSLRNAQLLLEIMGFNHPEIRYEESYEAPMTVIDQYPGKNNIVSANTPIELVVSQRSFADYLPGVYRESTIGGFPLLKDFLWIFRHLYDDLNQKIDQIPDLFSPYKTPPEFLSWLSQWVGFVMDENWPEKKKRELLRGAVNYYKIRGTVKGLKLYLSHFTDVEPDIIENEWPFKGFQIGVHSTMEVDSIIFHPVNTAHCFIVNIPLEREEVDDELIIKVHDIIRSEKPAHTIYYLRFKAEERLLTEFKIVIGDGPSGAYIIGEGQEIAGVEFDEDYIIEEEED